MIIFICLFAVGVIVFPIYLFHAQITANVRHQNKLYQKAISRGHEATAILKRSYAASNETNSYLDRQQLGKYRFEYKGRTYNIRLLFDDNPPYKIQVYWLINPRKADTRGGIRDVSWPWVVAYLIAFVIAYWIAT